VSARNLDHPNIVVGVSVADKSGFDPWFAKYFLKTTDLGVEPH
jgi:hypothetical protein